MKVGKIISGVKKAAIGALILSLLVGCSVPETEATKRAEKDREASLNGLNRVLRVYSHDGKLLEEYEGTFDIESDVNKVKFDLNGKRMIIYNAIVISEER